VIFLVLLACTHPGSIMLGGDDTGADSDGPGTPNDTSPDLLPGDTSEGTDTGEKPDKDAIYFAWFDETVIHTVDITISDRNIRELNSNGREYVEADVVVDGTAMPQVGLRLKGSSTYQDLNCSDGYCKASFKIKTDEYLPDQKYGSLQRITLNNMTSDYTQSKEVVVYNVLRDASQLGSRCSYVRVTINGEPWGLYANVEAMDDEWVKRRFEDAEGNLWATASSGADFTDTGLARWELNSGDGDKSQLKALTRALKTYNGDFFGELSEIMNADQYLDYWAWCAAVGNYDGYPFTGNDVILYEDPLDERRVVFMPWGTDESFDQYEVSGRVWWAAYTALGYACLEDSACVTELKTRILANADLTEDMDMLARAQAAWDISEADVTTDPVRPFTPDYVWYYRDYYAAVIDGWPDYTRAQAQ
jgi:spore coat protein CotH